MWMYYKLTIWNCIIHNRHWLHLLRHIDLMALNSIIIPRIWLSDFFEFTAAAATAVNQPNGTVFLSNFKTSMKAPANSSTLQIKPTDYCLSMNENGNLRLFWSKTMIQLVDYTFECFYWTHFISQIIQKWVSHTGTYGHKFNSYFLWKKIIILC